MFGKVFGKPGQDFQRRRVVSTLSVHLVSRELVANNRISCSSCRKATKLGADGADGLITSRIISRLWSDVDAATAEMKKSHAAFETRGCCHDSSINI